MFIKADYTKKAACYTAVIRAVEHIEIGDTITIDCMMCEERVVHLDVVKALIHTAGEELGRTFATSTDEKTTETDDGWTKSVVTERKLNVTCTGLV